MTKYKPVSCRWNGVLYDSISEMALAQGFTPNNAATYVRAGLLGHGDLPSYQTWYTIQGHSRVYRTLKEAGAAKGVTHQRASAMMKQGQICKYKDKFKRPDRLDNYTLTGWLESGDKKLMDEAQCILLHDDGLSLWDIADKLGLDEIVVYGYLRGWNDGNN